MNFNIDKIFLVIRTVMNIYDTKKPVLAVVRGTAALVSEDMMLTCTSTGHSHSGHEICVQVPLVSLIEVVRVAHPKKGMIDSKNLSFYPIWLVCRLQTVDLPYLCPFSI